MRTGLAPRGRMQMGVWRPGVNSNNIINCNSNNSNSNSNNSKT